MPAHDLSNDVLGYVGYEEKVAQQIRRLEVGGPCPALILMLTSELQLSDLDPGGRTFKTQLLFVPPAARPAILQLNGSKRCMEVELAPWAASAITGMAPRDWPRRALPLAEVGKSATLQIDRLACGDSTFEVLFTRTDRILGARIEAARRKVPEEIRWAWSALTAHRGTVPVRELALEVGWSRRYFISCFTECTGLTPKFLSRSFRFQRARQFIATGDLPIAQVASICGYSDQSHFTRECVAFAGFPHRPSEPIVFPAFPASPPRPSSTNTFPCSLFQDIHTSYPLESGMTNMTLDLSFLEIGSSNATLTGAFLGRLLGWTFHPLGAEGEGWFQCPTMKVGLHGNDPSPGFLVFFGVPDLDAAIRDVVKLGGTAEGPTEEPGFGRFCICTDPSGLKFGLHHQPQGQ